MSLVKWAFIIFVTLPAAELGAFVLVALMIGWLWTVVLFLATSLAASFCCDNTAAAISAASGTRASEGLRAGTETPGSPPCSAESSLYFRGL
jgi:UPF0716 family protein affecting phage T7 exclusion